MSRPQAARMRGWRTTTLHRHFASRDDLLVAVALDALDRAEAALHAGAPAEGGVADALQRATEALLPIAPQLAFLLGETSLGGQAAITRRTDAAIAPLVALGERAAREGLLRRDVTPDWLVGAFFALLLAAWDGIDGGRLAPRLAPRLVVDTLLSGVGA